MTKSEPAHQDHLDDCFDQLLKLLSELPTDSAMKELTGKTKGTRAIRQVIETMAIKKKELITVIAHMRIREKMLMANAEADRTIQAFLEVNPNYDIQAVPK